MANIKISELEEYTEAKDSDLLVIVDTTNNETKKIENFNLSKNKLDKTSIKNIKTNSDENIYSCNYVNTAIGSLDDLKTIDKSSVVNSINEIDNRFTYSTDERVIGTWLGKPLYRKVVEYRFGEKDTENVMAYIPNLKRFIKIDGYWVDANTLYDIHQSFDGEEIFLYASASKHEVYERHNFNYATGKYAYVIIDYTKTTD